MRTLNPETIREGPSPAAGTQAIARAAALLRELASHAGAERGLAELARSLELERPTVHRILRRLVEEQLVRQNPATRAYRLGPLVYELGLVAEPPSTLYALCEASLTTIAQESGDTAFAFIASAFDIVCFDRREGSYPVKALMLDVGRRRPMGAGASSLAMLAAMPEADAEQVLDANAARLRMAGESDVSELKRIVEAARRNRHVLKSPLDEPEILSLGVAVRNVYGKPVMGLSISALAYRIRRREDMLLNLLHAQADQMERLLKADAKAHKATVA